MTTYKTQQSATTTTTSDKPLLSFFSVPDPSGQSQREDVHVHQKKVLANGRRPERTNQGLGAQSVPREEDDEEDHNQQKRLGAQGEVEARKECAADR